MQPDLAALAVDLDVPLHVVERAWEASCERHEFHWCSVEQRSVDVEELVRRRAVRWQSRMPWQSPTRKPRLERYGQSWWLVLSRGTLVFPAGVRVRLTTRRGGLMLEVKGWSTRNGGCWSVLFGLRLRGAWSVPTIDGPVKVVWPSWGLSA